MKPKVIAIILTVIFCLLLVSLKIGPLWLASTSISGRTGLNHLLQNLTNFGAWFQDVHQLSQEKDTLAQERNQLLAQVAALQAEQRENTILRQQLDLPPVPAQHLTLARTAGTTERGGATYLLIDKGTTDGVHTGQIVLSDNVLVGRIKDTSAHASIVQLPQSLGSIIPVVIHYGNDATKGVVQGDYNLTATLTQVLPSQHLESGSTLVTSGDGGTYPPNLVVGKVGKINSSDSQAFQTASVNLLWNITQLEEVFIVSS